MKAKNVLAVGLLTLTGCSTNQARFEVCPGSLTTGAVSPGDSTVLGPTVDELVQALDGVFRVDYAALTDGTVPPDEADTGLVQPALPEITLDFEPEVDSATWMRVDGACHVYPTGYIEVRVDASIQGSSAGEALAFSGPVRLTFTGTDTSDAVINSDDLAAATSDAELQAVIESMPITEPLIVTLFSGQPMAVDAGSGDGFLAHMKIGHSVSSTRGYTVWNGVLIRDDATAPSPAPP